MRQKADDAKIVAAVRRLGENGIAPTYRELAFLLGYASSSSVRYRVLRLEQQGLLHRRPGTPRAIVAGGAK